MNFFLPIFAQAANSASFTNGQLGAALGICAFLVALAVGLKKLFGHEPPLHKEYVTRIEVDKIEKTLKDDLTKQAGARKDMHKEIATLQGDVKVLQRDTESQTRQLMVMDQKMDQVLLRLPRKE